MARRGAVAGLLALALVLCAGRPGHLRAGGPTANAWSAAGTMTVSRAGATATPLASGKVLVAGGTDGTGNPLASAELYDPVAGRWTLTGSMAAARAQHTATVLPNGQVLVAGGAGAGATAELYNPATGSWTPTGSMITARYLHSATLLANGQVLVAAGQTAGTFLASAELYDPAGNNGTGSWTPTGGLATTRAYHTATLLPNGKVLVAGGWNDHQLAVMSAELYDPAAGAWSATAGMLVSREGHTATLLSGPSCGAGCGKVLVIGGNDTNLNSVAVAELYDPVAAGWTPAGSLFTARFNQTATLLASGEVLVAGGQNNSNHTGTPLASAELYNPAATGGAGNWALTGTMVTAVDGGAVSLLAGSSCSANCGRVLTAGGAGANAELYTPPDASVTSVGCGTGFPGLPGTCTATVTDPTASGATAPGGTVTFAAASGSFVPANARCTLAQKTAASASCTVTYVPAAAGGPIIAGAYGGDGNHSGSAGTATGTIDKVHPALYTTAGPGGSVGAPLTDMATLASGYTPTGTITFNLYGPNDATCANASTFSSTVPVTGNGSYPSAAFTTTALGTYRWIASYSGDANNAAATGACNDANESAVIIIPGPGDVNGDGQNNAIDALCVLRFVATLSTTGGCPNNPSGQADPVWDVNGDGAINAVDALCLLRFVAGLPATPSCPSPLK